MFFLFAFERVMKMNLIQTKEEAMERFSRTNCQVDVPTLFSLSPSQYATFYTLERCDDIYRFIRGNSGKNRRNNWEELKAFIMERFSNSCNYDSVEVVRFRGQMLRFEIEIAYPFLNFQEQLRDVISDDNFCEIIQASSFGYRWFYEVEKELVDISEETVSRVNQGEYLNVYASRFADVWNSVSVFQSFVTDYMLDSKKAENRKYKK